MPVGSQTQYTDAMTLNWSLLNFPPLSLIAPVVKKVSQDKAGPVMIPKCKHLLRNLASPLRIHPMYPSLHLALFHLSGNSTKQRGFQRTLFKRLKMYHKRHTSHPGDYGIADELNGKAAKNVSQKTYQSPWGLWHS